MINTRLIAIKLNGERYKTIMEKKASLQIFKHIFFSIVILILCLSSTLMAQSGLEGQISNIITNLVRIINILIVGFVVWSGFLIAKGDKSGVTRLIYGIIGLIVVNAAQMIINYFR